MNIQRNSSLKGLNTFGIEATAKLLVAAHTEEDLKEIIDDPKLAGESKLVLGGGSNILLKSDVNGLVILNKLEGIVCTREDEQYAWIRASAGVVWHQLVLYVLSQNLGGIENLSLIPGYVGAAPIQNIGAYGVELKDVFHELEAMDIQTGEKRIFSLADCDFGYRLSVFKNRYKNRYVITSVTLRLTKHHTLNTTYGAIEQELQHLGVTTPDIHTVSQAVINIRSSKLPDPAKIGRGGS